MSEEKELKPLSDKHQIVLDEYVKCWEKTAAYKIAYPKSKHDAARTSSARLFADANFQAHLQERLKEFHMDADEALKLQSDIARGDITEFMNAAGGLDFQKLMENGRGRLIKKIKQKVLKAVGESVVMEVELELYPADVAQERILKVNGKFKEQIDLTNSDGSLKPEEMKPSEILARADALRKQLKKK